MKTLFCFDHKIPLDERGYCDKCDFVLDMQSTYLDEAPTALIVDDDAGNREWLQGFFVRLGYYTLTAENGMIGFKKFRQNDMEFNVIITDYQMPEMNGLKMVEQIRQLNPNQKIAMMSGDGSFVKRSLKSMGLTGLVHVFEKPFRGQDVETWLKG